MSNTRDTSNDYRKKHKDAMSKLKATEAKIRARAQELVKQHPDVVLKPTVVYQGEPTTTTVSEYFETIDLYEKTNDTPDTIYSTDRYIKMIEAVEVHIASQHPHIQTTIPYS